MFENLENRRMLSVTAGFATAGSYRVDGTDAREHIEVVVDFVGEGGSTAEGLAMTRQAGDYHVVGYGENVDVPTIDLVSAEKNVIGNLVGSYNDLVDLMTLAAQGRVRLATKQYSLDDALTALDDLDGGRVPGGRAILTS